VELYLISFFLFFSSARYLQLNQNVIIIIMKKKKPRLSLFALSICVCVCKMKRRSLMLSQRPQSWCSATSGGRRMRPGLNLTVIIISRARSRRRILHTVSTRSTPTGVLVLLILKKTEMKCFLLCTCMYVCASCQLRSSGSNRGGEGWMGAKPLAL
jgi:hypothetical protein